MGTFAHIGKDGVVDNIIVIDQETLNTGAWGDPSEWVDRDAGWKNPPGKGMTYSEEHDDFLKKKPLDSFVLNETTLRWEPPIAKPDDEGIYHWNEENLSWKEMVITDGLIKPK